MAAIHEHANDIQTVVLNGVEFRTRHNNYGLRSLAKNNKTFQLTENIEFPDVPPEVLNSGDVMAQTENGLKHFMSKIIPSEISKQFCTTLKEQGKQKKGDAVSSIKAGHLAHFSMIS